MARLTVEASELKNVNVDFISIVPRGATRIPFRILKEDPSLAGFDLASFFQKSADSKEATRQAAKKADAVLEQALAIVKAAGYAAVKSEPASDGSGTDSTSNPAAGKDAGGAKNDGDGADETGNPAEGKDAGGPRNDGSGNSTVKKEGAPPWVKKPAEAEAKEGEAEEEAEDPKKEAKEPAAEEEDEKSKEAPAKGEIPDNFKKTEDAFAEMKALFQKSADDLASTMTSTLATVVSKLEGVEARLTKAEDTVSKSDKRIAGIVPHSVPPDPEVRVIKGESSSYPLLDTGYSRLS